MAPTSPKKGDYILWKKSLSTAAKNPTSAASTAPITRTGSSRLLPGPLTGITCWGSAQPQTLSPSTTGTAASTSNGTPTSSTQSRWNRKIEVLSKCATLIPASLAADSPTYQKSALGRKEPFLESTKAAIILPIWIAKKTMKHGSSILRPLENITF